MTASKLPEHLTSRELAAYLNRHRNWPAEARMRGDGPPFLKLGRMVLYRRADIEQWLAAGRRTSTAQTTENAPKAA